MPPKPKPYTIYFINSTGEKRPVLGLFDETEAARRAASMNETLPPTSKKLGDRYAVFHGSKEMRFTAESNPNG